jgi:hypothetical protein
MAEYRAVCPYHQIKSEIHVSEANAALAACDTRSFCQMCQEEARQVKVTRSRPRTIHIIILARIWRLR